MKIIAKNIVTGIDYEDWLYGLTNFFHKNHPELPANIWISVRVPGYEPQMWIQRNKPLLLAYWEAKYVGSEALVDGLVF